MTDRGDRDLITEIIENNRYLTLATTDGRVPWIAPLEYIHDEAYNFYFLSTEDCRHARHIARNSEVSLAVFEHEQPEYSPSATVPIRGVQMRGRARRLSEEEYPEAVVEAIEALDPPMPPYAVFEITTSEFYAPKLVDGVNERVRVDMGLA